MNAPASTVAVSRMEVKVVNIGSSLFHVSVEPDHRVRAKHIAGTVPILKYHLFSMTAVMQRRLFVVNSTVSWDILPPGREAG